MKTLHEFSSGLMLSAALAVWPSAQKNHSINTSFYLLKDQSEQTRPLNEKVFNTANNLHLSIEQDAKIEQLINETRNKMRSLRRQRHQVFKALVELDTDSLSYEYTYTKLNKHHDQITRQILQERQSITQLIRAVLTIEQKQRLVSLNKDLYALFPEVETIEKIRLAA